jgi:hypothetical protein
LRDFIAFLVAGLLLIRLSFSIMIHSIAKNNKSDKNKLFDFYFVMSI